MAYFYFHRTVRTSRLRGLFIASRDRRSYRHPRSPPPTGRAVRQPYSSAAVGPGRRLGTGAQQHTHAHVASVLHSHTATECLSHTHWHTRLHTPGHAHIQTAARTHTRTAYHRRTARRTRTHTTHTDARSTLAHQDTKTYRATCSWSVVISHTFSFLTEYLLLFSLQRCDTHRHVNMTAVTVESANNNNYNNNNNNNNENPCNIFLVRRRTSYYRFRHNWVVERNVEGGRLYDTHIYVYIYIYVCTYIEFLYIYIYIHIATSEICTYCEYQKRYVTGVENNNMYA